MCKISIQSTPELWYVTMDLRYVGSVSGANEPAETVPLWNGQFTFDKTYNNRSAVKITLSKGTTKVLLSSVITGHGYVVGNFAQRPTSFRWKMQQAKKSLHSCKLLVTRTAPNLDAIMDTGMEWSLCGERRRGRCFPKRARDLDIW